MNEALAKADADTFQKFVDLTSMRIELIGRNCRIKKKEKERLHFVTMGTWKVLEGKLGAKVLPEEVVELVQQRQAQQA